LNLLEWSGLVEKGNRTMNSRLFNFIRWMGNTLRYNGLMVLSWRLLRRGFRSLGNLKMVTFFLKDLTQPLNEVIARVDLTITLATESDIEPLVKLMKERYKHLDNDLAKKFESLFLYRLQRGGLCFLGKIENEIIHYNWVSFNRNNSLEGRFVDLRPDEALCLDAFTLREWRGKGIYPAAHYRMLQILQAKGYRKAYALVDTDNKSSKKPHFRQGWKPFGTVLCFTPQGSSKSRVWRIKGNPTRFLEEKIPVTPNSRKETS
jgi:hypothetical protein